MAAKLHIHTRINGEAVDFLCEARHSLLEVLRETLGLTGTKEGCSNGNCGACNVLLDGVLVNSCLVLAAEVEGRAVTTIEGLAPQGRLHPVQQAYIDEAALQCGICTPGFILSTVALLERNPNPSEAEARRWLSGNLCRCTGYDHILKAVMAAAAALNTAAALNGAAAMATAAALKSTGQPGPAEEVNR